MSNTNMTDEQKLRVLNHLMWLQVGVYSCDNVENIPWYSAKRIKYLAKNLIELSLRDYGKVITSLWSDDGVKMGDVTSTMEGFCKRVAKIDYWRLHEVNHLLDLYSAGKLDHLFTNPAEDEKRNN